MIRRLSVSEQVDLIRRLGIAVAFDSRLRCLILSHDGRRYIAHTMREAIRIASNLGEATHA